VSDGNLPIVTHPYFDLRTPISIGHRGCAGEAPENTLCSFERALSQGAAILESDVHLTRDGVPVLIHDPVIDRVTNGSDPVADRTLAELQRFDAGHRFSLDGGRTHPFRGRGVAIPSLEEAFDAFPGARFNLELKSALPGIVDATVEQVVKHRREAITLLTAGDDEIMRGIRARLDRHAVPIAQGASEGDVRDFIRTATHGDPPRIGPMALQIPADFAGRPLATRELLEYAHAQQIQVHVWTINEPAEMIRLLDLGVDGIITDYPGRLAALLSERRDGS
jgi:glycerophosphoryl diester phosphodiesterase